MKFLRQWGVHHRGSSAYNPQSNGRAEVAVKTVKRMLQSNVGPSGSLNTDAFLQAMLQLRNTPDPDCHLSPAQVIFGRPLRDKLAFANRLEKYSNPHVRPTWREAWSSKEEALRQRYHRTSESLREHSRPLCPLTIGDRSYIQNQSGNHPKRWDRSGTIVDSVGHDSYLVKVDGSGRVTQRNRRFLRQFVPVSPSFPSPPKAPSTIALNPQDTYRDAAPSLPLPIAIPDTPPAVPAATTFTPSTEPPNEDNTTFTPSEEGSQDMGEPRPRRSVRAPLRYQPETGKWV